MRVGFFQDLRRAYLATTKGRDVEEIPDLLVYRPLAYAGVRLVAPTPVTANQVTVASMFVGVLAGWLIGLDTTISLRLGALLVLLYNIMDCMDGQLARLRGSSSPFGYVLDGVAGYVGTFAIMMGIGHALASRSGAWWPWWPVTIVAGVSLAWWCAVVDGMRLEWFRIVQGKRRDRASEIAALLVESEQWRREGSHRVNRALIACYAAYIRLWGLDKPMVAGGTAAEHEPPPEAWADANRPVLRLALLAGPTMQMTGMILAAAFNKLDWFLWVALVVGNAWAIGVLAARAVIRRRLQAVVFEEA